MSRSLLFLLFIYLALFTSQPPVVGVTIDWVTVRDAGNAPDPETGWGAVPYEYQIGKFEITATQYVEFLNAVASDDTFDLYSEIERFDRSRHTIIRSGEPGSYAYRTALDAVNWPANHITFWEAARFANWMHNGQPTGAQNATTTEDGAYTLTPEAIASNAVTRNPDARYFIPSEDEWYKAAFYKGGGLDTGYWNYPTQHDTEPLASVPTDNANAANYQGAVRVSRALALTTVPTDVGSYPNAIGPYGTYDQAGNVYEWTERIGDPEDRRGNRGGSFFLEPEPALNRTVIRQYPIDRTNPLVGLRLARPVPEPAMAKLLFPFLAIAAVRRRCFVVQRRA